MFRVGFSTHAQWVAIASYLLRTFECVFHRGSASFDKVVLACHADDALRLIEPSRAERDVLGTLAYRDNVAVLHSDESAMPCNRRAWSSWNVTAEHRDSTAACHVTYWMNRLQRLPGARQFLVSLNPCTPPRNAWVERHYRTRFSRPLAGLRPSQNPPKVRRVRECNLTVKLNRGHAN